MVSLIEAALLASAMLAAPVPAQTQWTAAWASAQMPMDAKYELKDADGVTVRQIVRVGIAGSRVRVRLTNAFGKGPLIIEGAAIAYAQAPGLAGLAGVSHPLTFAGQPGLKLAAGEEAVSDPVDLPVNAFTDLAISFSLSSLPSPQTGHVAAHATGFRTDGDRIADAELPGATSFTSWVALSEVDVAGDAPNVASNFATGAIAAIGDSITDGTASATDANARWTDYLARRLKADGRDVSVLNLGIGGNCVLRACHGPAALDRLDRDVFARDGVRWLIVAEGINDLGRATKAGDLTAQGHADLVKRMEDGYRQIVARGHAHGLKVFGATITPDDGSPLYHPDAAAESDRQALNAWIRTSDVFDGVIDFDAAVRNPAAPERLQPVFDSGDHLHPGPGYGAMADAVDLGLFRR
jgi:lysophospholipase L1-like esterase